MDDVKQYRKRPVVVEAVQYDGLNGKTLEAWIGSACLFDSDGEPFIRTLEGDMRVGEGDYIIRGVQGEFYPCKADIFEQTYEVVR